MPILRGPADCRPLDDRLPQSGQESAPSPPPLIEAKPLPHSQDCPKQKAHWQSTAAFTIGKPPRAPRA